MRKTIYFVVQNCELQPFGCLSFNGNLRLFHEKLTHLIREEFFWRTNFDLIEKIDSSEEGDFLIEINVKYYNEEREENMEEKVILTRVECF